MSGVLRGRTGLGYNEDILKIQGLQHHNVGKDPRQAIYKGEVQRLPILLSGTSYTHGRLLDAMHAANQDLSYLSAAQKHSNQYTNRWLRAIKRVNGENGIGIHFSFHTRQTGEKRLPRKAVVTLWTHWL